MEGTNKPRNTEDDCKWKVPTSESRNTEDDCKWKVPTSESRNTEDDCKWKVPTSESRNTEDDCKWKVPTSESRNTEDDCKRKVPTSESRNREDDCKWKVPTSLVIQSESRNNDSVQLDIKRDEMKKKELSEANFHRKELEFMADNGLRQLGPPRIGIFADRQRPEPLQLEPYTKYHIPACIARRYF